MQASTHRLPSSIAAVTGIPTTAILATSVHFVRERRPFQGLLHLRWSDTTGDPGNGATEQHAQRHAGERSRSVFLSQLAKTWRVEAIGKDDENFERDRTAVPNVLARMIFGEPLCRPYADNQEYG
jgi:hypothetical protein